MDPLSHLDWPFLEPRHRALAQRVELWAAAMAAPFAATSEAEADLSCRRLVEALAGEGLLDHAVALERPVEARALCLIREILARHAGLADFAFAMQGLGSAPLGLFGSAAQRRRFLPAVREGRAIAAFALSEPEAGSDVAALATAARKENGGWRLDGEKTWISNGGLADFYILFARSGEGPGAKGLSAFILEADTPGLEILERIAVAAPHPLAKLRLSGCRLRDDALLGAPGEGFKIAMATLDLFRPSVGAAALGFARRALAEALARAGRRKLFGGLLGDLQLVQGMLAEMACDIDASALLVYRAAWAKDSGAARITREAAMAKLHATEAAQRVIDRALQIMGGAGLVVGSPLERLYREVRALRIYEGASEVQKVIIARQLLASAEKAGEGERP